MCQGSLAAYTKVNAVAGKTYRVSNGGDPPHTVAVLHLPEHGYRKKDGKIQCAACIQVPTMVVITNVPKGVQQTYGVNETLVGRFMPGTRPNTPDYILLQKTRQLIPFNDFIGKETRLELVAGEAVIHQRLPSLESLIGREQAFAA